MRTFRVMATMTTYLYADVEAENEGKALKIAKAMDGADFHDRLQDDDETIDTEELNDAQ